MPWAQAVPIGWLILLLAADAAFITVHIFKQPEGRWSLGLDRGHPELFGYAKTLLAIGLLALAHRASRQAPYRACAAVVFIIALDDSLRLHENAGHLFERTVTVQPPFGLRPQDIGELGSWSLLGLLAIVILVMAHRRGDDLSRQALLLYVGVFVGLVGFAALADMVHITLAARASSILTVVEDGGELIMLTFVLCLAMMIRRRLSPGLAERER